MATDAYHRLGSIGPVRTAVRKDGKPSNRTSLVRAALCRGRSVATESQKLPIYRQIRIILDFSR